MRIHNLLHMAISDYCVDTFGSPEDLIGYYAVGVGSDTGEYDNLSNAVGYWFDNQTETAYLEPVCLTKDYDYAMQIAQQTAQTCIAYIQRIDLVLSLETFAVLLLFKEEVLEGATIIKTADGYKVVVAQVDLLFL